MAQSPALFPTSPPSYESVDSPKPTILPRSVAFLPASPTSYDSSSSPRVTIGRQSDASILAAPTRHNSSGNTFVSQVRVSALTQQVWSRCPGQDLTPFPNSFSIDQLARPPPSLFGGVARDLQSTLEDSSRLTYTYGNNKPDISGHPWQKTIATEPSSALLEKRDSNNKSQEHFTVNTHTRQDDLPVPTSEGFNTQRFSRYMRTEESQHRQILEPNEKFLGPQYLSTLTSVNNLAEILWKQGKHEAAEIMYRRVLDRREKVLGPDYLDMLTSVNSLA